VLLTITTTHEPATDLGYLLHKNPERPQSVWDVAFAYEALARAHAIAGDMEGARAMTERALQAVEQIVEDDSRKMVLADLETIPGQPRFW
jgi:mannose/cellobiose epimerase-like protein (N-acyl-D-glucosamine 2-epimerase family)